MSLMQFRRVNLICSTRSEFVDTYSTRATTEQYATTRDMNPSSNYTSTSDSEVSLASRSGSLASVSPSNLGRLTAAASLPRPGPESDCPWLTSTDSSVLPEVSDFHHYVQAESFPGPIVPPSVEDDGTVRSISRRNSR